MHGSQFSINKWDLFIFNLKKFDAQMKRWNFHVSKQN
jgi:hypothetical protein